MDYRRNQKYFSKMSWKLPIVLIVIGAIIFLAGVSGSAGAAFFGILLIAAGVAYIVLKTKGTPTDQEYDSAVQKQLDGLKAKALSKLGIDEDEVKEIEPIVLGGYDFDHYNLCKLGKDNKWRTNRYEVIYLFFSQNEVHCYSYEFCTTEEKKTESTDVYFYQDIVSASTASTSAKLTDDKGVQKDYEYESFKLTTAGGTALNVSMRDVDEAQRSINAMRQLLRAKKQQG